MFLIISRKQTLQDMTVITHRILWDFFIIISKITYFKKYFHTAEDVEEVSGTPLDHH